jgi:hypothetical protein
MIDGARFGTVSVLMAGLWTIVALLCAPVAIAGVVNSPCPDNAITVAPGDPIQATIDRAGAGAVFCLKNGIHRLQAIRPWPDQHFYGEGRTILNGSRSLTGFRYEAPSWVVDSPLVRRRRHGECLPGAPLCNQPETVFIDDQPLSAVADRAALAPGKFYIDYVEGRIYLADNPANRSVEVTVASFAFESTAMDVSINNIIVEKFASSAQQGAINAHAGAHWTIENCEVRLNSGGGIGVGAGTRVQDCDIHDNGQLGIGGSGRAIRIEHNDIWSNNSRGFDATWEAGGAKLAQSDGVVFRDNHVHDNNGPGLWCDIDCRDVLYEGNIVERNQDIGIFHEISFKALIRNNVVRHNGLGNRGWFWMSDIVLAASQDVDVQHNRLVVAPDRCAILLIDQGRRDNGKMYQTRNNTITGNDMTFEGAACAGGISDTRPGSANFTIIADGNNGFDANTYRVNRTAPRARFVWGHEVTDWPGFQSRGQEQHGALVAF